MVCFSFLLFFFVRSRPVFAPTANWNNLPYLAILVASQRFVALFLACRTGITERQGSGNVMVNQFGSPTGMDGIITARTQWLLRHVALRHRRETVRRKNVGDHLQAFMCTRTDERIATHTDARAGTHARARTHERARTHARARTYTRTPWFRGW